MPHNRHRVSKIVEVRGTEGLVRDKKKHVNFRRFYRITES
jgi:hypothetical protein